MIPALVHLFFSLFFFLKIPEAQLPPPTVGSLIKIPAKLLELKR
jgi:hypothetical protein